MNDIDFLQTSETSYDVDKDGKIVGTIIQHQDGRWVAVSNRGRMMGTPTTTRIDLFREIERSF